MKKTISWVLMLLASFLVLSGCSAPAPSEEDTAFSQWETILPASVYNWTQAYSDGPPEWLPIPDSMIKDRRLDAVDLSSYVESLEYVSVIDQYGDRSEVFSYTTNSDADYSIDKVLKLLQDSASEEVASTINTLGDKYIALMLNQSLNYNLVMFSGARQDVSVEIVLKTLLTELEKKPDGRSEWIEFADKY